MKTFRLFLLSVAGLIGLASCTTEGYDNYLEDSSWVAKIDMERYVLPSKIDVNEQSIIG